MNTGTVDNDAGKENIDGFHRLFFALCPGDDLRHQLAKLAEAGNLQAAGKRVPVDNMHITLVFLGQVKAQTQACIEQVAAEISGPSFRLILDRIGYWSRPQILWLAPSRVPGALSTLYEKMCTGLGSCSVTLDTRRYRPHMTLARKVKKPPPGIRFEPLVWDVRQYSLMKSSPSQDGGVNYQELACWQLG